MGLEYEFFEACKHGDAVKVQETLDVASSEQRQQLLSWQSSGYWTNGWNSLHVASRYGHQECVGLLIEAGAEIEAKNKYEWSALHLASENGHQDCAGLLIEAGAEIEAKDKYDQSALHLALDCNHGGVVGALLEAGADRQPLLDCLHINEGVNELHYAAKRGWEQVVKFILSDDRAPALIEARTKTGETPLVLAIENRQWASSALIIERSCRDLVDVDAYFSKLQEITAEHPDVIQHFGTVKNLVICGALNAVLKQWSLPSTTTWQLTHIIDRTYLQQCDNEKTQKYKVVGGNGAMVRKTPDLDSPEVKSIAQGEVVEAADVESMYADHPLVRSGRRVRLVKPVTGYASLHTESGQAILTPEATVGDQEAKEPHLQKQNPEAEEHWKQLLEAVENFFQKEDRSIMIANAAEIICRAKTFHGVEVPDLIMEETWEAVKDYKIEPFTLHCLLIWACQHIDISDMRLSQMLKEYSNAVHTIFSSVKLPLKVIVTVSYALEDAARNRPLLLSDLHALENTLRKIGCMILDDSNMDDIQYALEAFGVSCFQDIFHSNSAIAVALDNDFADILSLPQIQCAVEESWKGSRHWSDFKIQDLRYTPSCNAICNFLFYLVYLYMTFQVVYDGEGFNFQSPCNLLLLTMSCGYLWKEYDQLKGFGVAPYKKDPWNIWDIIFIAIFFVSAGFDLFLSQEDHILANRLLSLNLFILPFRSLQILSVNKLTGVFVVIIHRMFGDIFSFLVLFSIVLVGFAWVFCCSVSDVDEFSSFGSSIQSLFGASLGDFDFGWFDDSNGSIFARLLLLGYLLVSMVMMMNLLIAVLSDSYATLMEKKHEMWCLVFSNIVKDCSVPETFPASLVFPPAMYMLNAVLRPLIHLHYSLHKRTLVFAHVAIGLMFLYDAVTFLVFGIPVSLFVLIPHSFVQFKRFANKFNYLLYAIYPLYHVYFVLIRWIFFSGGAEKEHQNVLDLEKAGKTVYITSVNVGTTKKEFSFLDGVVNHSKMSFVEALAAIKGKKVAHCPAVLKVTAKSLEKGTVYEEGITIKGAKAFSITCTEKEGNYSMEVSFLTKEKKELMRGWRHEMPSEQFKIFCDQFFIKVETQSYTEPDHGFSFEVRPIFDSNLYYHLPIQGELGNGSISVNTPDGNRCYTQGGSLSISWTSHALKSSNVKILLTKGSPINQIECKKSGGYWVKIKPEIIKTITASTNNNGSYDAILDSNLDTGYQYQIKVIDDGDEETYAFSESFTVQGTEESKLSENSSDEPSTLEGEEESKLSENSSDKPSTLGGTENEQKADEKATSTPPEMRELISSEGTEDEQKAEEDPTSTPENSKKISSKGCWNICSFLKKIKGYEEITDSEDQENNGDDEWKQDENNGSDEGKKDANKQSFTCWNIFNIFSEPKQFDDAVVFDKEKTFQPRLLPEVGKLSKFNELVEKLEEPLTVTHIPFDKFYEIPSWLPSVQKAVKGYVIMDEGNELQQIMTGVDSMEEKLASSESRMKEELASSESQIKEELASSESRMKEELASSESRMKEELASNTANQMEVIDKKIESLNASIKHLTDLLVELKSGDSTK